MLGALRASGATADAAGAGIDRIPEIADNARETGLTVHFAVYGDPVPLPDSVSQAAYRIVQEAVTNTLKHAHAGVLDIRVRYLSADVELDVTDDGRGGPPGAGGGMGLIGMRERVAVHDGVLEHGPLSGGGYRVRARLPYTPVLTTAGAPE
jgi:signal transduction histidine kinase